MTGNKTKKPTEEQIILGSRIFDLVVGRVLKRMYEDLDDGGKANMEKVFLSNSDDVMAGFVRKSSVKFKKIFKEEAGKVENRLKEEIMRRL